MTRVDRMLRRVRRWRDGDESTVVLDHHLGESDERHLRRLIEDCLAVKGGEVAARRRASTIGEIFTRLDDDGRRRFFEMLATDYGVDHDAVDRAVDDLVRLPTGDDDPGEAALARDRAEQALRVALTPRREDLLRRLAGLDGGLGFLIDLREDLLDIRNSDPRLRALDADLRRLLERWFDVTLLHLTEITWDSPAALLEKLIEYEAVHEIESWDDLRGRLGPARRCFAFMHPVMPDEPLIFVEVALTDGISTSLAPLLDHGADRIAATEADTAIFYSISNCHRGLAGVALGDFLIKRVVTRLRADLPQLERFSTLSPIPDFRSWLERHLDDDGLVTPAEARLLVGVDGETDPDPAEAAAVLRGLVERPDWLLDHGLGERVRPVVLRLVTRYLLAERRGERALDPVAHFHLSNGARVEQLNWRANTARRGWERGLGMMVNYRYVLDDIEKNHDVYTRGESIPAVDRVRKRLEPLSD